jgi:hypothetical protein
LDTARRTRGIITGSQPVSHGNMKSAVEEKEEGGGGGGRRGQALGPKPRSRELYKKSNVADEDPPRSYDDKIIYPSTANGYRQRHNATKENGIHNLAWISQLKAEKGQKKGAAFSSPQILS